MHGQLCSGFSRWYGFVVINAFELQLIWNILPAFQLFAKKIYGILNMEYTPMQCCDFREIGKKSRDAVNKGRLRVKVIIIVKLSREWYHKVFDGESK